MKHSTTIQEIVERLDKLTLWQQRQTILLHQQQIRVLNITGDRL